MGSYLSKLTDYAASFSVSQLALKVLDSGLDLVDGALTSLGSEEEGAVRSGVKMVHSAANTIRVTAVKKAGTEKAKKIEEASILGAFIEVSGLQDLLGLLGFRLRTLLLNHPFTAPSRSMSLTPHASRTSFSTSPWRNLRKIYF